MSAKTKTKTKPLPKRKNKPGAGRPRFAVPYRKLNTCLTGEAGTMMDKLRGDTRAGAYLSALILADAKRKGM